MASVLAASCGGVARTWSFSPHSTPAVGDDGHAKNATLRSLKTFAELHEPMATVRCLRFNHNGKVLVTGGSDGRIVLSHIRGHCLGTLPALPRRSSTTVVKSISSSSSSSDETTGITSLCFSSGSRYLCSGDEGGLLKIWDLKKKQPIRTFRNHRDTYPVQLPQPSSLNLEDEADDEGGGGRESLK